MNKLTLLLALICIFIIKLTAQETGTFVDERDSHEYKWVKIGSQTWMAENLAYLPSFVSPLKTKSQYGFYVMNYEGTDSNEARTTEEFKKYGVLYNWEASRIACPKNWHLPSREEWLQLINFISASHDSIIKDGFIWSKVGGYLKDKSLWNYRPDGSFFKYKKDYQFNALLGGIRTNYGTFNDFEKKGYWWLSNDATSEGQGDYAYWFGIDKTANLIELFNMKGCGLSVRCIKD